MQRTAPTNPQVPSKVYGRFNSTCRPMATTRMH
jgi:hypothetical protein